MKKITVFSLFIVFVTSAFAMEEPIEHPKKKQKAEEISVVIKAYGKEYKLSKAEVENSLTLKHMLADIGEEKFANVNVVELDLATIWPAKPSQEIWELIVAALKAGESYTLAASPTVEQLTAGQLIDIIKAANYLDIPYLLDEGVTYTADYIRKNISQLINSKETVKLFNQLPGNILGEIKEKVFPLLVVDLVSFNIESQQIWSVVFSPDEKKIAYGADDGYIRLFDIKTGQKTDFKGHTDGVLSVAFNSRGDRLVSGSKDDTIKLWDVETGTELKKFLPDKGSVTSVAFSPDDRMIVSGFAKPAAGNITLWDVETGERRTLVGKKARIWSVAFSPDGKKIVSGSSNGIGLWDVVKGKETSLLECCQFNSYSVTFSPDGNTAVSGGYDSNIELWDAKSGVLIKKLLTDKDAIFSVRFSPNGKKIVSGYASGIVRLWDVESGAILQELVGNMSGKRSTESHQQINSVAYSPFVEMIASGSADGVLKIWGVLDYREFTFEQLLLLYYIVTKSKEQKYSNQDSDTVVASIIKESTYLKDIYNTFSDEHKNLVSKVVERYVEKK